MFIPTDANMGNGPGPTGTSQKALTQYPWLLADRHGAVKLPAKCASRSKEGKGQMFSPAERESGITCDAGSQRLVPLAAEEMVPDGGDVVEGAILLPHKRPPAPAVTHVITSFSQAHSINNAFANILASIALFTSSTRRFPLAYCLGLECPAHKTSINRGLGAEHSTVAADSILGQPCMSDIVTSGVLGGNTPPPGLDDVIAIEDDVVLVAHLRQVALMRAQPLLLSAQRLLPRLVPLPNLGRPLHPTEHHP